jgi:hypothetical protein
MSSEFPPFSHLKGNWWIICSVLLLRRFFSISGGQKGVNILLNILADNIVDLVRSPEMRTKSKTATRRKPTIVVTLRVGHQKEAVCQWLLCGWKKEFDDFLKTCLSAAAQLLPLSLLMPLLPIGYVTSLMLFLWASDEFHSLGRHRQDCGGHLDELAHVLLCSNDASILNYDWCSCESYTRC